MPQLSVTYFPLPGRAEPMRLCLAIGGISFEDKRVTGAEWGGGLKAAVAPKQLPLMEVDGKTVGQSMALGRYCAKLSMFGGKPLYPEDPMEALLVDEMVDFAAEIFQGFGKTFSIENQAEKEAARAALVKEGGDIHKWAKFFDDALQKNGTGFVALDRLTLADICVFTWFWQLISGQFDGFPKDCFDGFPNLVAHKKKIASIPEVARYYSNAEGCFTVYKA